MFIFFADVCKTSLTNKKPLRSSAILLQVYPAVINWSVSPTQIRSYSARCDVAEFQWRPRSCKNTVTMTDFVILKPLSRHAISVFKIYARAFNSI